MSPTCLLSAHISTFRPLRPCLKSLKQGALTPAHTKAHTTQNAWFAPCRCNQQTCSRRQLSIYAGVLPVVSITATQQAANPAAAVAVAAAAPNLPAILTSAGIFIVCCAAAALLLSAVPLLWCIAKTANRMESMLQTLEAELPDTAASMRLSSLELSDCISELGGLGSDVTNGIRASARLLTTTEATVKQGAQLLGAAVVPALARKETELRGAVEAALKARAALTTSSAALASTTAAIRKIRGGLLLTQLAGTAVSWGRVLRQQLQAASAARVYVEYKQAPASNVTAARGQRQRQQQQQSTGAATTAAAAAARVSLSRVLKVLQLPRV